MRVLVLDQSGILPWLVEHASTPGTVVQAVRSVEEAERAVRERPPDAAVVSMPHAQLPWARFQHLCAVQQPPVPVLYESCIHRSVRDAGIDPDDGVALFLHTPAHRAELERALADLLELAQPHPLQPA
jgi:hypothetical protein